MVMLLVYYVWDKKKKILYITHSWSTWSHTICKYHTIPGKLNQDKSVQGTIRYCVVL